MSVKQRLRNTSRAGNLVAGELADIEHGRFERVLSGLTAAAAVISTAEVCIEHYKAGSGGALARPGAAAGPVTCRHHSPSLLKGRR